MNQRRGTDIECKRCGYVAKGVGEPPLRCPKCGVGTRPEKEMKRAARAALRKSKGRS